MESILAARDKLVLFGGAGLVGQNLVLHLGQQGHRELVVIDKHSANLEILRRLHPWVETIEADMAEPGPWQDAVEGAAAAIMLQAQIGGEVGAEFHRNNVVATELALASLRRHRVSYLVHISSSVVNSLAHDWYTESKKAQEALVAASGLPHCILRPTLMFGWFDRKHLGWLSRFMDKVPIFPVPGTGRFMRQPLYVRDFCQIILSCLRRQPHAEVYDITGAEKIDYIDIIREIRRVTGSRTWIVRIPYFTFWLLLKTYALFSSNPPFTAHQLRALVTPDEFRVVPWWDVFGVQPTPFARAVEDVFGPSPYRNTVLEF